VPSLRGIDLSGADLRSWWIGGGAEPLSLDGAALAGCDLREASFANVDASRSDLRGARLDRATLIDVELADVGFEDSHLTGTVFRRCQLDGSRWAGAAGYRTQYLLCRSGIAPVAGATPHLPEKGIAAPLFSSADPCFAWLTGHTGWVSACAWSRDGRRLANAGSDGTLRRYDAASGDCLRVHAPWRGDDGQPAFAVWSPPENRMIAVTDQA
jgi:hypothetical protein